MPQPPEAVPLRGSIDKLVGSENFAIMSWKENTARGERGFERFGVKGNRFSPEFSGVGEEPYFPAPRLFATSATVTINVMGSVGEARNPQRS